MFKEVFKLDSVATLSEIALVIFVVVFVVTAIWIYTRPRKQVRQWSRLPLEDGIVEESRLINGQKERRK
jgi:energy-converting hydrogenase Eha subunit H